MRGSKRVRRLKKTARESKARENAVNPLVLGYIRVSTEGQFAEGYGLDVQEKAIRSFAASQGYELIGIELDRVSGAIAPLERPGFRRVLRLAEQRAFAVLLLYKFDRLARNVMHAVNTVHELREQCGVVLRSVTEPIDTATPMGEMIFTVLASMAAQERLTITERTWGGRREKASNGGFAGGAAPYGYRKDKDGGIAIDEVEALVIQRIFAMRERRLTMQAIAATLIAEGVPTRRGGTWRASQVAYILDNPKYRGEVEYLFSWAGKPTHVLEQGAHPAIIAEPSR